VVDIINIEEVENKINALIEYLEQVRKPNSYMELGLFIIDLKSAKRNIKNWK